MPKVLLLETSCVLRLQLGCDCVIDYTKERFEDASQDGLLDCVIDGAHNCHA